MSFDAEDQGACIVHGTSAILQRQAALHLANGVIVLGAESAASVN